MSNKIWYLRFVAGNPKMFSKVTTAAGSPFTRERALYLASNLGQDWRVWVEDKCGNRIYESQTEKEYFDIPRESD